MARPLRILIAGGWYHVSSRGNRREPIYRTEADRRRFLGVVAELPERFGIEIHAFVLMNNHYHLVVRTPEANLSDAMRWLHVSYTSRFNWMHQEVGHLFQGRYKAMLIEETSGVSAVARYVHLNPVRVGRYGLGKAEQQRSRAVGGKDPGAALVAERLAVLREYRWSSWRVYQGAEPEPAWLTTAVVAAGCGGRSQAERRRALRQYTEVPIREGRLENPWEGLVGGVILGGKDYAQRMLKRMKAGLANREEQTPVRRLGSMGRMEWSEIVRAAEKILGKPWEEMVKAWGDWGRDGTIYVAVRHGRHRLADIVRAMGNVTYGTGAQAVRRFGRDLKKTPAKARFVDEMKRHLAQRGTN